MLRRFDIKTKILLITFLILFVIAIPLTLIQVQKQQELRQRAQSSTSVSFEVSPLTLTKNVGEPFDVKLSFINTTPPKNISAFDVTITYNPDTVKFNKFTRSELLNTATVEDQETKGSLRYIWLQNPNNIISVNSSKIDLGTLTFEGKTTGQTRITFSPNASIVTSIDTPDSSLTINTADNKIGEYTITTASTAVGTTTTPTSVPTPTPPATIPNPTCAPQPSNCQQFLCTRTFFTDACLTPDPKFCPLNFCSPTDQTSDQCGIRTKTTCVGTATPTPTPTPTPQPIQCNIDTDEGQFRCRPNCFLGEIVVGGSTTCNRGTETICCLDRNKRLPTPTPTPSATCNNSSTVDNDCFKRFGTFCAVGVSCIQNPQNKTKDCICDTLPTSTPAPTPLPGSSLLLLSVKVPGLGLAPENLPRTKSRAVKVIVKTPTQDIEKTGVINFDTSDGLFKTDPKRPVDLGTSIPTNTPFDLVIKVDFFKGFVSDISLSQGPNPAPKTPTLQVGLDDSGNVDVVSYFNVLTSCFGTKPCENKLAADLNDDGSVDGVDFNIFLKSIRAITIR